MLEPMQQPNDKTCGQTTLAMLTNVPVNTIIGIYGHNTTSSIADAKYALRVLGIRFSDTHVIDNRKKLEKQMPLQGYKHFVRLKYGTRNIGHFLAMDVDGKIYDTNKKVYPNVQAMLEDYNKRWQKYHGGKVFVSHYFTIYDN